MNWWQFGTLPYLMSPDGGTGNGGTGDGDNGQGSGGGSGSGGDGNGGGSLLDRAERSAGDGGKGGGGSGDGDGTGAGDGQGGEHRADRQQDGSGDGSGKDQDGRAADAGKLIFKDRPDWLPPNFWSKESGEVNVEALAKSQKDLRDKIASGEGKAPEKSDDYKWDVPDELKDAHDLMRAGLEEGEDDPVMAWFKKAAHENGLSQTVFSNLYAGLLRTVANELPGMPDPDAEFAKLGNRGQALINNMAEFRDTLVNTGTLKGGEVDAFEAVMATADGIRMFQKIREWYGEKPVPIHSAPVKGTKSATELRAAMGEVLKKANAGDPSAEAEYQKLQADYEALYGNEPAGTSAVMAP